jgi:acyl carrier protein
MDDILKKVREAFVAAINAPAETVTATATPEQIPGWDSLGHVAVGAELEKAFGISLAVDDLMEMEDIPAILRVVRSKLGR